MDGVVNVTPADIEFLAEDVKITIVPSFEAGQFLFLEEPVGPFLPQRPLRVPLWLAVSLRKRQKCAIQAPEWLTFDALTAKLEEEKQAPNAFSDIHPNFQEIAAILFDVASEIPDVELCRRLIQDIKDVRFAKIRKGLDQIKTSSVIKLNNITALEITSVRRFFVESMNTFHKLSSLPES